MLSALGTMFVEKKDIIKLSDAIKEVTSKGKDFYPSNGQTIKHQSPYASVCADRIAREFNPSSVTGPTITFFAVS